nr:hypothetical protein HK105_005047 [Polyrhizophydium stewartii]
MSREFLSPSYASPAAALAPVLAASPLERPPPRLKRRLEIAAGAGAGAGALDLGAALFGSSASSLASSLDLFADAVLRPRQLPPPPATGSAGATPLAKHARQRAAPTPTPLHSAPFDSAAASSKSASSATDAVSIRPPSPDIIGLSGLAKGRQNPSLRREMSVRDLARAVVFGIAEVSEGDCDGGERRNTDKVGDNGGDRDTQTFSGSDQSSLKIASAPAVMSTWVDNGPFSDQPEPHPSQHVDGSDASGATPLLIQPTAAHLDLDDASDGPNHTEDAGRSVRPNLGYEDLDQDLLSSPQIHEEILLTQAIASPPSPSIVSQAVSAFISADADRQEPEVSVSTKASSMPSIPEAGEAAEPAAEPPPHRSHDAKDEQVQPGQDHAADPNVDHLHDLTRSQLVQILSLEHTDPATDEIDTVDTDDTVGTDTQAVEERPKHTADAAPDHAAAVDDLPHMPDAPMHLGLLSTQMLARIPLDAFLDDDDNDDGDKVEADLEPARSASDAHQMVLAADDVVAAFELAEARAAAKSDPSRAEQATPRVSEDVSDSDDAHSIDDDLLRHVHLTTQHFSDDGRAGASPATSGEDLGDTFNRDKGGLRMGRAAHGLPAYVPPPVWQTPRAPPQPQHQLRRGQENGMPGFVFASGKRASVSREAQHIGAVLLLDDDDVAPVGTQLVRSRVDAAALVPGTVRPMILRDAAMATRPSQSDGNAPSAQRAAAQARIATQPFRTPFKTVEQPSAASAPQSAPPAMSGFTTGARILESLNAEDTENAENGVLHEPKVAPTIQTPAARRGLLHPNARDSLVAASPASGLAPSEHGARARESGFLATRHVHLPTAPLIDVALFVC